MQKSTITCTTKIEFDAAHRVIGHENKCKYLHGHRFTILAEFAAENLDNIGRIIDFGEAKNIIKKWIDDNFDHTAILSITDREIGTKIESYTGQKIYYLDKNPTAENLANHLYTEVIPELFKSVDVRLTSLRLYETPNCYVDIKKSE